ncbi:hypothetical protein AD940_01100 [Gluconobacter thailandicus]|uniref:phage baseplate assembly protein V n=1 Tax=Gluconobacter thailandicus TaxID=257438 RepID=UPI000776F676|nr:phage baseplate assembly protein V [Gluconobacter thailandicus]KXV35901.1 hypothetical protein AD940_01100 [Gluconobacter thailandicus]
MSRIAHAVSRHDREIANLVRVGTVQAVQGNQARVAIGNTLTDWLYWTSRRAFDAFDYDTLTVGEQVLVLSIWGDVSQGVIVGAVPQDAQAAPTSGVVWGKRFKDGATITYDPDRHSMTVSVPEGAITIETNARVRVKGPALVCDGSISAGENLSAGNGASGAFTTPTGQVVTVSNGIITEIA